MFSLECTLVSVSICTGLSPASGMPFSVPGVSAVALASCILTSLSLELGDGAAGSVGASSVSILAFSSADSLVTGTSISSSSKSLTKKKKKRIE